MYKDGQEYFGTHWWWDSDDNEYIVCATWKFEKNYPDMPDLWHLQHVEVEQYNGKYSVLCRDIDYNDPIWVSVEEEGPPMKIDEKDNT